MADAVFLLLFCAGAWQVWRQSPRYSAKALGLTLGTVVVLIGLIAAVTQATAQIGLLGLVAFLIAATLAGCSVILRVTDGPMAASAPAGRENRRKVYRLAGWMAAGVVVMAAMNVFLAGFGVLCGAPIVFGLHHKALRTDRAVAALRADSWMHWSDTYLGDEGLLVADEYTPWALSGTYLVSAAVDGATLVLRFYVYGKGTVVKRLAAPGALERRTLEARLRGICPKAQLYIA